MDIYQKYPFLVGRAEIIIESLLDIVEQEVSSPSGFSDNDKSAIERAKQWLDDTKNP